MKYLYTTSELEGSPNALLLTINLVLELQLNADGLKSMRIQHVEHFLVHNLNIYSSPAMQPPLGKRMAVRWHITQRVEKGNFGQSEESYPVHFL